MIKSININALKRTAKRNNWVIFDNHTKAYDLNLWVIRSANREAGIFDDTLIVFWKVDAVKWEYRFYRVTADPSEVSLFNSKNDLGVAIIKQGQHRGAWALGLHKGQYDALVQVGNITVIRDFNQDEWLDIPDCDELSHWKNVAPYRINVYKRQGRLVTEYLKNEQILYRTEVGSNMGINCHRASSWKILERVGLYSEGCVVHHDPVKYKDEFIPLMKQSAANWDNKFSFVLCHEEQLYY